MKIVRTTFLQALKDADTVYVETYISGTRIFLKTSKKQIREHLAGAKSNFIDWHFGEGFSLYIHAEGRGER